MKLFYCLFKLHKWHESVKYLRKYNTNSHNHVVHGRGHFVILPRSTPRKLTMVPHAAPGFVKQRYQPGWTQDKNYYPSPPTYSHSRRDVMRLSNKRSPYLFGVATANRTKVTTPNQYGAEIIARMSDWENTHPNSISVETAPHEKIEFRCGLLGYFRCKHSQLVRYVCHVIIWLVTHDWKLEMLQSYTMGEQGTLLLDGLLLTTWHCALQNEIYIELPLSTHVWWLGNPKHIAKVLPVYIHCTTLLLKQADIQIYPVHGANLTLIRPMWSAYPYAPTSLYGIHMPLLPYLVIQPIVQGVALLWAAIDSALSQGPLLWRHNDMTVIVSRNTRGRERDTRQRLDNANTRRLQTVNR